MALGLTQALTEMNKLNKGKSVPLRTEVPRGFQEVKVPRLRDNDPGRW